MYVEFNIFFSDLNEDAQRRLLSAIGESDPKEMNWDMDVIPLAIYCTETDELTDEKS